MDHAISAAEAVKEYIRFIDFLLLVFRTLGEFLHLKRRASPAAGDYRGNTIVDPVRQ